MKWSQPPERRQESALRALASRGVQSGFVRHVARCCAAAESALRRWLETELPKAGFSLHHDDYATTEGRPHPNLLARRGEPSVVLVTHTDTCREHAHPGRRSDPCLRKVVRGGTRRWILQDRACRVQLGADDRLGVAIATWVGARARVPLGLLFTTDEEIGLRSARHVPVAWGDGCDLFVQIDRGADEPQLVTSIHGMPLCGKDTERSLIATAEGVGLPRAVADGRGTDVFVLKMQGVVREAVNLTCGYHRAHREDEFVDVQEAWETVELVRAIVSSPMVRRGEGAAGLERPDRH